MLTCANVHHPARSEKDHVILISDQIGPRLREASEDQSLSRLSPTGQTVCSGDPQRPCYKIAYFQDVWSRVAFKEASEACEMDGGSLLSIQTSGAVGWAGAAGGIADGDFWIGLIRVDDHTPADVSSSSCSDLYRWTDGSPVSFRWNSSF
uniref:C-type lectin domain-containing protein n=1 Tax=Takifugu rubripes TaxID=31033 RepID=H2V6T5_TAKRU